MGYLQAVTPFLVAAIAVSCAKRERPEAPRVETDNDRDHRLTEGIMTWEEAVPFRKCEKDSDCVYVKNGCCDCGNGGRNMVVNKDMVEAYVKANPCPGPSICTMMGRTPPCGSGVITCREGLCQYRETKQRYDDRTRQPKYPNGVVPDAELIPYRHCMADSDCVYVNNLCCNCATIGKEISLHRDRVQAFHNDYSCEEMGMFECPDIDRDPPCGSGKNLCKDGLCTYVMPELTPPK